MHTALIVWAMLTLHTVHLVTSIAEAGILAAVRFHTSSG